MTFLCAGVLSENNSTEEPLRLVGEASRCAGTVEVKHRGEWRRGVEASYDWDLGDIAAVCRDLDCGSAVSGEDRQGFPHSPVWSIRLDCVEKSTVTECVERTDSSSSQALEVECSDSVRLVSGSGLCSGSVQIWNQSWTWLCEEALDLQGAEVLCRELGCGAPSLLQGAVSPLGLQTFHCEGHESALMDCPRSTSGTCSSGAAVNLTCSEPLRLVGEASRCAGTVEVKHRGEWRRGVEASGPWVLRATAAVCRDLDCGSAVSGGTRGGFLQSPVWRIRPDCVKKSTVTECVIGTDSSSSQALEVECSDSVRLVSGSGLCSGSVQIWNQSWTWLCEEALDLQGAEVLCRELGCGAPSLLQGAVSPLGLQTFHCEGHESALMDCPRSTSWTCSSGAAVNLTCSEPLRLVGGASRCAGTVEVKYRGEWRRGEAFGRWDLRDTAAVCRDLDCGSAVSGGTRGGFLQSPVWRIRPDCVKKSTVRECVMSTDSSSSDGLDVVCSDLLNRPIISLSVLDGPSEAQPQGVRVLLGSKFRVKCSVEPQFPGGSFQLLSPSVDLAQNHTLPAVNHSAHFLFSDTSPAHKGNYTCVYHLQVFNHNFSSQSHALQLYVGSSDSHLIFKVLVTLPLIVIVILLLYYCKVRATRGASEAPEVELELDLFGSS
ncbi:antigen WC1.1-like [Eucyclogobius newberryi]|uniref:antigen WC1.1-like n=1 Tax=Eucyclogobius newberryi TaxID=166745 RepID=UPI003B5B4616